jgi:cobalt-zinc-cadmium efflux system membrane fusion protein
VMSAKYSFLILFQQHSLAVIGMILLGFCAIHPAAFAKPKIEKVNPIIVREGNELIVPADSPLRSKLVVSQVTEVASPHILMLPGVVEANPSHIVNILPPLTGRLTELKVNLGDVVKEGQTLAIIHSPDLSQAYSDMDKARDALDLANKALNRARGVNVIGANAVKELEQITSNYEQAMAEFKRAEARLNTLVGAGGTINGRVLSINAPISGTITALNSGMGAYLNDPTATMMTLSNLDNLWVTAYVPENLLSSVAKGQEVDVELSTYPGQIFHGVISFTSALLEPDTHRNKARIAFANEDGKLKPNMYATVSIMVPETKQIVVPLSALLMNNDNVTVFVEVAPWTFVRRVVELGQEDGNNVRILSGLVPGDRVVIRGGVLLND